MVASLDIAGGHGLEDVLDRRELEHGYDVRVGWLITD
jgi:hypothetical protein